MAARDSAILRILLLVATFTFAPRPVASLSWIADLQPTSDTDAAIELPESFHVVSSASGSLSPPTVLYPVPSGVTFGSGSVGTIFKTAVSGGGNIGGGGGSDSGETTSFVTITDTATAIETSAVVSLSAELILTGTQVFSAGVVIGSGIGDGFSGDPSASAASSLFLDQSASSVPFDDSQSPSTTESDAGFPTTTFPNAIQITPTLSPSTTIFTIATSYSLLTTAGHVTSTSIAVLSTSVMMGPVTPTQTSNANKHSLSTSMSVGIAVAGVAVFLAGVLVYIVRWRRRLRRRAFLRIGEDF